MCQYPVLVPFVSYLWVNHSSKDAVVGSGSLGGLQLLLASVAADR